MRRASIADVLLALAVRLLPPDRAEWGAAMRAEAETLPARHALGWASGCVMAALGERLKDARAMYWLALPVLIGAFLYVEWHTDEATVSLAVLMSVAAALAFLCPGRIALTGIVAGAVPVAAHALANFTWVLVPFYQYKPLEPWEWLIVAALFLPALTGACIGSLAHRALKRTPR